MSAVGILIVGVGLVLLLPLAWRIAQRRFDPFEPIFVFALAWGAMFVIRPMAMLIRDDLSFFGVDISETLDTALLLALVGAVGFVAGYEVPSARRLACRLPTLPVGDLTPRALPYALATGALGTLMLVFFLVWSGGTEALGIFLSGRSEEFNDVLRGSPLYLWWLSLAVVPAAVVGFAIAYLHRRPGTILGASALFALALIRILPTGNRGSLLMLAGSAVVFVYLHKKRRPGIVAVSVGLAAALVGSYTILLLRYAEDRESVSEVLKGLTSTPERVVAPVIKGADAEMVSALAGALLVIPSELPYRYGAATLGDLATRPIPRQLWDAKPEPHTDVVTEAVWPVAREVGGFQPAYTPLLSFYWDFGLLGVFGGMAAYGWLTRFAYRYLLRGNGTTASQVLYGLGLWTLVVAVRADPVQLFFHSVIMFLPVLVIARLELVGHQSASGARTD